MTIRSKTAFFCVAVGGIALALWSIGPFPSATPDEPPQPDEPEPQAEEPDSAAEPDETVETDGYHRELSRFDAQIQMLDDRVAAAPTDWARVEPLVGALMERARLTGSLGDYQTAVDRLDAAFAHAAEGSGPLVARMRLNYTLHRFDAVRADLATLRSSSIQLPATRAAMDAMDAQLLLVSGQAPAAVGAFDRLVDPTRTHGR